MDLNDLNLSASAELGATLNLEHPITCEPLEHDGKPLSIKLAGTDSAAYKNKQREFQNKRIQKMAKRRKVDLNSTDHEECALLAACTLGWSNIFDGKEKLEFSVEAAEKLYAKYGWIKEQVDEFIGDRNNFFTTA